MYTIKKSGPELNLETAFTLYNLVLFYKLKIVTWVVSIFTQLFFNTK